MNQDKQWASVIQALVNLQRGVASYIGSRSNVSELIQFLEGFLLACDALGYKYGINVERQILAENGWERRADGVWLQMRERGMSEEAIVSELIRLEIEKWKKQAAESD